MLPYSSVLSRRIRRDKSKSSNRSVVVFCSCFELKSDITKNNGLPAVDSSLPVEPYLYSESSSVVIKVRFGMFWWIIRGSNATITKMMNCSICWNERSTRRPQGVRYSKCNSECNHSEQRELSNCELSWGYQKCRDMEMKSWAHQNT